ncbi:hypothetical protein M378DRAFT_18491 [Amanita muscaria Koide BX008]|uniref:Protein kinase domain-containing protein n=1 Tax=Amanita muscaria (strain Koide BX008) TaxID=946122 RepID=A0A0C2WE27_AMAMK|nr:hypothetical protein M378DRAFT_18491 [Amanita muscaria Koide BX008]
MNVSEIELHTKLRRMRSLLKFKPHIDVHHRSFLDFLNEPTRSGDYYVSTQAGTRRYVELVVDSIVRYVSRVIEDPDYHKTYHLSLRFSDYLVVSPLRMPFGELQDVVQPLVQIQDEALKLANSRIANDSLSCDKCNVFYIMHTLLLHLAIHRCIDAYNEAEESVTEGNRTGVITSITTEAMRSAPGNDLDSSLSSLLTHLQETKLELSPSTTIINHTYSILRFDCAEIAAKVRSISDAQRLVDLLMHLIDEKCILSQYKPDAMNKAARLVLRIFSRIPVLPRSLFLNVKRITSDKGDWTAGIRFRCEAALKWRVLDQNYVHLEVDLQGHSLIIPFNHSERSEKWRRVLPLDFNTVIELVLDVARAIQYLHLMGVTPGGLLDFGVVHLDLSLRPRIRIGTEILTLINPFMGSGSERSLYEDSIFAFGYFFYAAYFNTKVDIYASVEARRGIVVRHPSKQEIPEYAWQLMQRCCAEDPRNQPTIEEVVKEMETWGNQPK